MKRILFLGLIALTMGLTANAQRYGNTASGNVKSKDNTGAVLSYDLTAPTYTATLTVAPKVFNLTVKPGTLTGAMTINATETSSFRGDHLTFIFTSDGTGRVVTFGTNFISAGTLTLVASKQATASFIYDGTNYVEVSRAIQP